VYATATLGGGGELNRNSDPAAIHAFRNIYDLFLLKFPLFYAYWQRYAQAEFRFASTEAAELVSSPTPAFGRKCH
jgi:pre-mRNA-processing factor 39